MASDSPTSDLPLTIGETGGLQANDASGFTGTSSQGGAMVIDDVEKSPEDKRLYRGLVLQNGLRALLVSDPTTDRAAAALDVRIGMHQAFDPLTFIYGQRIGRIIPPKAFSVGERVPLERKSHPSP